MRSTAARWLADKENAADLVGGINVKNRHADVMRTLLDMSTTAQIKDSLRLGREVLGRITVLAQPQFDCTKVGGDLEMLLQLPGLLELRVGFLGSSRFQGGGALPAIPGAMPRPGDPTPSSRWTIGWSRARVRSTSQKHSTS